MKKKNRFIRIINQSTLFDSIYFTNNLNEKIYILETWKIFKQMSLLSYQKIFISSNTLYFHHFLLNTFIKFTKY